MDELLHEDVVIGEWAQPLGLHVEPLLHREFLRWQVSPARISGMPAFRVRSLSGGFFYGAVCMLEEAPTETAVGTYDRLRGTVDHALTQFASLNPERTVPNVLLWINQEKRRHPDDLPAVLKNFVERSQWSVENMMLCCGESRILDARYNIDGHVWLNRTVDYGGPCYRLVQDQRRPFHFDSLRRWFQLPNPPERN
jgi:hypothetical protein